MSKISKLLFHLLSIKSQKGYFPWLGFVSINTFLWDPLVKATMVNACHGWKSPSCSKNHPQTSLRKWNITWPEQKQNQKVRWLKYPFLVIYIMLWGKSEIPPKSSFWPVAEMLEGIFVRQKMRLLPSINKSNQRGDSYLSRYARRGRKRRSKESASCWSLLESVGICLKR